MRGRRSTLEEIIITDELLLQSENISELWRKEVRRRLEWRIKVSQDFGEEY